MEFAKIEPAYTSKDGCRLVWYGSDEDDKDTIILNKEEFEALIEILKKDTAGKVTLEDHFSKIQVNFDVTQFDLQGHEHLEVPTITLQKKVMEYANIPHEFHEIHSSTKEFYPSAWGSGYSNVESRTLESKPPESNTQSILHAVLFGFKKGSKQLPDSDIFKIFATRRSTRRFAKTKVEDWKMDKILAAADTAPTAGNFQGLKIFYVKNPNVKEALVEAANNQPYVNAPEVLVFCMDTKRVKLNFPPHILEKFSMQDATLAASYAQIAAAGLGLSTLWIGMIDEEKMKFILNTDLRPSSILCIGYPDKRKPPKTRRKLKELIEIIE